MKERKYKKIKRHLSKAYKLILDNDVISEKQEYVSLKIRVKSVIYRLERNHFPFTRESRN